MDTLPIAGAQVKWVNELPAELPGGTRFGPYLQALPDDALFVVPDVGRFRVREGRQIEIEVAPGCARERAASFARLAPFGALIHQRGDVPLHASAVMRPVDGMVLLIAGASGAGKSTTAAALVQRGWQVLNDDVSRLTFEDTEGVLVWPGFQSLKLWDQSCRLLNIDRSQLPATGEIKQKYFWSAAAVRDPQRVSAIVELCRDGASQDGIQRMRGATAVQLLGAQTYRPRLVRALGRKAAHFQQLVRVANQVLCFRISVGPDTLPAGVAERLDAFFQ
ncbi:MAG TPA: hypothetical protein VER03_12920 [Bryobacteraceae bacterium]|nr:hypothetical protein [Bryobacteraceae bacterium]